MFEKPKPMTKSSKRRSQDKYCSFHEDHGHDTEECRDLAADVDALVKQGALKRYQDRRQQKGKRKQGKPNCAPPTEKKPRQDPEEDDEPQYDGVITTITALPVGKTKTTLKAECRGSTSEEPTHKRLKKEEVITFSDADPVPSITPHQDAIVIQAGVANKLVYRVFVDTGASVSILFKDCFDKLELDAARLAPAPLPLKSFVQEDTRPEGIIDLPVTVGKAPTSSTSVVQFFVVKAHSPYNIILGRDWLNAVRTVCSTYHLMV